jgi:hypothetical protein
VLGKDGNAYLLNRTNMGGMSASPVRTLKVANSNIIEAPAVYTTAMWDVLRVRGAASRLSDREHGRLMAVRSPRRRRRR